MSFSIPLPLFPSLTTFLPPPLSLYFSLPPSFSKCIFILSACVGNSASGPLPVVNKQPNVCISSCYLPLYLPLFISPLPFSPLPSFLSFMIKILRAPSVFVFLLFSPLNSFFLYLSSFPPFFSSFSILIFCYKFVLSLRASDSLLFFRFLFFFLPFFYPFFPPYFFPLSPLLSPSPVLFLYSSAYPLTSFSLFLFSLCLGQFFTLSPSSHRVFPFLSPCHFLSFHSIDK